MTLIHNESKFTIISSRLQIPIRNRSFTFISLLTNCFECVEERDLMAAKTREVTLSLAHGDTRLSTLEIRDI